MKRTIFITVFSIVDQGGISTSIQNLLHEIHNSYEVTLCPIGDYISPNASIPSNVHVIKGSSIIRDAMVDRTLLDKDPLIRKIFRLFVRFLRRCFGTDFIIHRGLRQIKVPNQIYDVAICFSGNRFIDGQIIRSGEYELVSNQVNARRKVGWIHNDINKIGYTHDIFIEVYKNYDAIVLVSQENKALAEKLGPEYSKKMFVVYNTYNLEYIKAKANQAINPYEDNGKLHFVTVARLSIEQKRQDRIIKACGRLKQEGFNNFDWYIVGGGDKGTLEKMVAEYDVADIVRFTGLESNPYPYMLHADAFVLTSSFEGYGMTIKEAQILGCPTLVTNFGPAHEAVMDGCQGFVCDNSTEGVYLMMKRFLLCPSELITYRQYLKDHPVNNEIALAQFRSVCYL